MTSDALRGHDLERDSEVCARQGIAPISFELIHDLLLMPENWRIVGAFVDDQRNAVNFKVESDELPETERGDMLPTVRGLVRTRSAIVERTAEWGIG